MDSKRNTVEDETEDRDEVQELKRDILKEWLKVFYIFSAFISLNVVPGLLFATVVAIEMIVVNVPTVTLHPLAIHATSDKGVLVTKLIKKFRRTRHHTKLGPALLEEAAKYSVQNRNSGGKQ